MQTELRRDQDSDQSSVRHRIRRRRELIIVNVTAIVNSFEVSLAYRADRPLMDQTMMVFWCARRSEDPREPKSSQVKSRTRRRKRKQKRKRKRASERAAAKATSTAQRAERSKDQKQIHRQRSIHRSQHSSSHLGHSFSTSNARRKASAKDFNDDGSGRSDGGHSMSSQSSGKVVG